MKSKISKDGIKEWWKVRETKTKKGWKGRDREKGRLEVPEEEEEEEGSGS